MSSTVETPDAGAPDWAVQAEPLARAALLEIADDEQIGPLERVDDAEDGVYLLRFAADLSGYQGWLWTADVTRTDDRPATVLEAELLPGEGALVAPAWVPWSQRFAEFRERHEEEVRARRALRAARGRHGSRSPSDDADAEVDGPANLAESDPADPGAAQDEA